MAALEAFLGLTQLSEADRNWVATFARLETEVPEIATEAQYADYERRRLAIDERLQHIDPAKRRRWREGLLAAALAARMSEWWSEAGSRQAA